ncbi:unnamed protein product [Closterium sp. NIES-54]
MDSTHSGRDKASLTDLGSCGREMRVVRRRGDASPDHLSYECPDRDDNDEENNKGGRGRSTNRRPRRNEKPRKEKLDIEEDVVDNSSGKSQGDGEASCSMVGIVERTVSLAPEAGEDFQAVAAVVLANPMAVLLDSGGGSADDRLGDEVDPWPVVREARAHRRRHDKSSAKHDVATGLDIKPSTVAETPCVSCVRGKLVRHTFLDKGSDAKEALAVVHIDLCGPFRVAAKDGSLYFLLLKDRHTWFVWTMPVAKKCDVLREFQQWLVLVERQMKKSVLMLRSDRGGEFLRKEFTNFVDGKGFVHDLTCPYAMQQNGMAEREMRTAVESWSTTPPGMTPHQLLTGKKPDLTLARVWGCMVQFMVPEQHRSGKLAPKARWGLHLGVSPESKGWEVLDLTDNKVVTSVRVIFYETLSLEVWKTKYGPASGRTQAHTPTDNSTATVPLLAEVDEPADEDVVEVLPPPLVLATPTPVADRPTSTPVSATGDEGSLEALPVALASGIAGGRQGAKLVDQDGKLSMTGEQQTGEPVKQEAASGVQSTGEQPAGQSTGELSKSAGGEQPVEGSKQLVND